MEPLKNLEQKVEWGGVFCGKSTSPANQGRDAASGPRSSPALPALAEEDMASGTVQSGNLPLSVPGLRFGQWSGQASQLPANIIPASDASAHALRDCRNRTTKHSLFSQRELAGD
jgi:hypothetical protein